MLHALRSLTVIVRVKRLRRCRVTMEPSGIYGGPVDADALGASDAA
jgi:hypothetical protein